MEIYLNGPDQSQPIEVLYELLEREILDPVYSECGNFFFPEGDNFVALGSFLNISHEFCIVGKPDELSKLRDCIRRARLRSEYIEALVEYKPILKVWHEIGMGNPSICAEVDPPFDFTSFYPCLDEEDLKQCFERRCWVVGQAFYLGNLCFIQQRNGGDEWLTIKDGFVTDSISWALLIERGKFETQIRKLQSLNTQDSTEVAQ